AAEGVSNRLLAPLPRPPGEGCVKPENPVPSQPSPGPLPFPRFGGAVVSKAAEVAQPPALPAPEKILPPPPPPVAAAGSGLVPPPEPAAGLSMAELPAPPARPSIGNKMKLLGVVGDRAIIAF